MAKAKIEFQAQDVWAAACAAQRINGAYIKAANKNMYGVVEPEGTPNRQVMMNLLTAAPQDILQEDGEQGGEVRRYYQALTFKTLKGGRLNVFDNTAMEISNQETITSFLHIAVMASLPSCHARAVTRDEGNRKINWADGGFIGNIGDKINLNIEVVKSVFSFNYNVNFVTGMTEQNQVVFFSYREKMEAGSKVTVKGTIKAHRDNSTQLTRVKVV